MPSIRFVSGRVKSASARVGLRAACGAGRDSEQNFYQTVAIANWAAFDQPNQLVTSMGQAAFDRMQDKLKGPAATWSCGGCLCR